MNALTGPQRDMLQAIKNGSQYSWGGKGAAVWHALERKGYVARPVTVNQWGNEVPAGPEYVTPAGLEALER